MISFLRRLLCSHEYVWVRNIHGDEINLAGGKRSWWRCRKCGKWLLSNALIDERGRTMKGCYEATSATTGHGVCRDVGKHGEFVCSECGVRMDVTDGFGYEIPTMLLDGVAVAVSYCPNCGRKVVE